MPLPSFTITGTLFDLLGNVAAGEIVGNGLGGATPATVTFTSNVPAGYFVTFGGAAFRVDEVVGIVNSDGTITRNGDPVQLLANDAGLSVEGLQWQCHAAGMKRFWFNAPVDGGTVNLGTVVPVPGLGVGGVAFSEGELITLLADDGSAIRVALDALYSAGLGAMHYRGVWNASTNSPTLADGTGSAGDLYRVSVAGTRNLGSGSITFAVGDYVIYNGSTWEKSDSTDVSWGSIPGQPAVIGAGADAAAARAAIDAAAAFPTIAITRDATGRVISVVDDGVTETYTRDLTGRVATIVRGAVTKTVTRDSTGRILGVA